MAAPVLEVPDVDVARRVPLRALARLLVRLIGGFVVGGGVMRMVLWGVRWSIERNVLFIQSNPTIHPSQPNHQATDYRTDLELPLVGVPVGVEVLALPVPLPPREGALVPVDARPGQEMRARIVSQ